jgi:ATP/maltotriose-dependent transcriptional regulator MalT
MLTRALAAVETLAVGPADVDRVLWLAGNRAAGIIATEVWDDDAGRRLAAAEALHQESIARLSTTSLRVDLARGYLLYGEWLRREGRRGEARDELRRAQSMLAEMGIAAFAERARRELQATGGKMRRRRASAPGTLTTQEAQIARLVQQGLSNPEIGTRLFLSARTVEWHLRNVFGKVGISSRRQLRDIDLDAHVAEAP